MRAKLVNISYAQRYDIFWVIVSLCAEQATRIQRRICNNLIVQHVSEVHKREVE